MRHHALLVSLLVIGASLGVIIVVPTGVLAAQFGRPDGDISTGNWEDTTGGDSDGALWDEMDEVTPDDSTTYVRANNAATAMEVGLSDVADPGVGTGHIIKFRALATGGGPPERVTFELYQGTTQIALINQQAITRGSWNTYQTTLSTIEADSITDYTDLRFRFTPISFGTSDTVDVTWAELEVPDVSGTCDAITVTTSDPEGILYFNETIEPDGLPWTTQSNVPASFQDGVTPALSVTNDATVSCDIRVRLMTDAPSGATLKSDTDNDPTGATAVPTDPSFTTVCAAVNPSGTCDIWLWTDYSNAGVLSNAARTLRVDSA